MSTMPGIPNDQHTELVRNKFSEYEIDGYSNSPNGKHYILKDDSGVKKHLKLVKKSKLKDNESSEVELLRAINNPNVIKLEDYGEFDDAYDFLLFPHINGKTLDKLKDELEWDESEVKRLLRDTVVGIKGLRDAGITHRDIKPKNIIREQSSRKYIILDLGIGYFMDGPNRDNSKVPRGSGSRYYSAPEQFRITLNERYCLTPATDQFSLAVVAYELITKVHPYIKANSEEMQNYANAVTGGIKPDRLQPSQTGISDSTCDAIHKMLDIEPSRRYLHLEELEAILISQTYTKARTRPSLFLQLPREEKEEFLEFIEAHKDKVDGVIVSCSDTADMCERIEDMDVEVLFDPKTYALQLNKSTADIARCLKLTVSSHYDIFELMEMKEALLKGAHRYSSTMHSNKVILPYFNVVGPNNEYLKFTKKIWNEAKSFYEANGMSTDNIYGAMVIPHQVIVDEEARAILLSQLMNKYPLDGIYVIFENTESAIATVVEENYLKGLKEICSFLETAFRDVIVFRTDLSAIPFLNSASFSTGWAKAARHFNLNGSGRSGDYKMKYYAHKLFTFIEEKSTIRAIIDSGGRDTLECSCTYCASADPLASGYTPHRVQEKGHFFTKMVELHSETASLSINDKNTYYKTLITTANTKGDAIKTESGIVTNEIIPNYETLIALIDD